jgi:hypothetical protein
MVRCALTLRGSLRSAQSKDHQLSQFLAELWKSFTVSGSLESFIRSH